MIPPSFRFSPRWLAFAHDVAMAAAAFVLALYLRLGDDMATVLPGDVMALSVGLFTLTCGIVFLVSGLYRSIWAFASLRDLGAIFRAVSS